MRYKYIIEIPDDKVSDFLVENNTHLFISYSIVGYKRKCDTGLSITPYTEPDIEQVKDEAYNEGYKAGREAEKVRQPDLELIKKKARLEGWKKGYNTGYRERKLEEETGDREEIKVGDEVIPRETEYNTMIVTRLWKDDYDSDCIDAIGFDGRISSFLVSRVSKTGKHYEIAAVLEKMRNEPNAQIDT